MSGGGIIIVRPTKPGKGKAKPSAAKSAAAAPKAAPSKAKGKK
jgi:hypothetical protein